MLTANSPNIFLGNDPFGESGFRAGEFQPGGNVSTDSDPLREPEEAGGSGERPPLGNRRQPRPGQSRGEAFQIERIDFREGFVRPDGQTSDVASVDAPGRRTALAA